jgi:Rhs element Vgr protein
MGALQASIWNETGELSPLSRRLTEVEIIREVNRVPSAELVLQDGDFARREFALSNEADLAPGKELRIKLEYVGASENGRGGQKAPPLFAGMIVRQSVEADVSGSRLKLELKSKSYAMTLRRRSRVFRDQKDSDAFRSILEEYGLPAGQLDDTATVHAELVQYNCTDWDFLLSRADFNGLWVVVGLDGEGKEIVDIVRPQIAEAADFVITLGMNQPPVYSMEMEADLSDQCGTVESFSWNSKTQKMTRVASAVDFSLAQGNLDPTALSAAIGSDKVALQSPAESNEEELQAWADAFVVKSRLSLLRGQISVKGEAFYQTNKTLEIKGVSERFNGRTLITGLRHDAGLQGWTSSLQFGRPASWFAAQADVSGSPAAAMSPPIHGLHIGKVEAYESDQERKLRVKVSAPAIHEKEGLLHARLGTPYAGKSHGLFFRPEVGDEVILGFFDDDPRHAVILGALYSEEFPPPVEDGQIDAENNTKAWLSRQGIKMIWDEKGPALHIVSQEQGGKKMQVSLGKDALEISDMKGNLIKMDDQGITIQSDKAVTLVAPKVDVN